MRTRDHAAGNSPRGKTLTRAKFLKGAAAGLAGGLGGFGLASCRLVEEEGFPPSRPWGLDAFQHHTLYQLRRFADWLEKFDRRGYVGEMNWPNDLGRDFPDDQEKWSDLGETWYEQADASNLWVTAFCADERQFYGGYWLSVYRSVGELGPSGNHIRAISVPEDQAQVVEAHPTTPDYRRGVNVSAAAEWVMPGGSRTPHSNLDPGVYGEDYWYPGLTSDPDTGQNTFEYVSERGVDVVRIPFRWERMQSSPGGPFDRRNLSELEASVAAAREAGLGVVLSLQNYGGYWADVDGTVRKLKLGTPDLSSDHFQDVWSRLSSNFGGDESVVAYDLMNEPAGAGGIGTGDHETEEREWESLTRDVVASLREGGDEKLLIIPGYGGIGGWPEAHPEPWISDERHMYTAHQYFDSLRGPGTGGGRYRASYADENEHFEAEGW